MMEDKPYTTQQHQAVVANIKGMASNFGAPVTPKLELCEERLKSLEYSVTPGTCYWLVDLHKADVSWHCGVEATLGYGHNISLFDTINWIHGAFRDRYLEQSKQVHNIIREIIGRETEHMKQRYVIKMPMRHQKGHYANVIRTSFPFQFDADHNMVSHLNYIFVDPSSKALTAFEVNVFEHTDEREDLTKELLRRIGEVKNFPFTPKEQDIMALYANNEVSKAIEVANCLAITISTVYTNQKNIHEKASKATGINFVSMADLAKYYRDRLLI